MAAPTYTLPTVGNPNSTEDPLVRTALSDLKTLLTDGLDDNNIATGGVDSGSLASNAVTTAKITDANVTAAKLAGAITDAKLSSPNNSVYKTIASASSVAGGGGTGNHLPSMGTNQILNDATDHAAIAGLPAPQGFIYFDDADFTVGSLTQKLRVRMQVIVGATSPSTVTITGGLYPITISAGNWTIGTVVTGTTAASSGLATNTISPFTSSDATIPSDGAYCLGYAVGSIAVPAGIVVAMQLQTRNV